MESIIEWEIDGRRASGFDDRWILNDLEHSLPAPRTSEDFTGDVWGAYIETMAVLSRITGKRYPQVDGIVRKALEYQRPDGSFWNVVPAEEDIPHIVSDNRAWGWQRALIGFIEYYLTFKEDAVLQAAKRLGDFLLRMYEKSNRLPPRSGMARTMRGSALYPPSSYWSAVTQGFVRLYQITKDKNYLHAAVEIADLVPGELLDVENTTDWLTWHGMMLLYEETGKKKYLAKAQKNVHAVMEMMKAPGDTPHLWNWPKSNEACGLADSITLNCDLWRATLQPAYMDAVERIAYNAFFAGMYPRGGCGRYNYEPRVMQARHADPQEETDIRDSFVDIGKRGVESCCDWHVPIAFRDVVEHIFHTEGRSDIYVNLFVPSEATFSPGKSGNSPVVRLKQETEYPQSGIITLQVQTDSPIHFSLRIRIPYWSENARLSINGGKSIPAPAGQYATLRRQWRQDVIRLELPMPIRLESADPPWKRNPELSGEGCVGRAVLLKGPVVLVLDKNRNPNLSPLWKDAYIAGIRPSLAVPADLNGRMVFELPPDKACTAARNPFIYPGSHYQGIWELPDGPKRVKGYLSPLAEVTASDDPSYVQFAFPVRIVAADQYPPYAALLKDDSFEMTEAYRQLLDEAQSADVWAPPLLECGEKTGNSYDAVLAAFRLGKSHDERALQTLVNCLGINHTLLQRIAVMAIRELGIKNNAAARPLEELAGRVPELRSIIQDTLTDLGFPIDCQKSAGRSMSWIDGPQDAPEYLLRRVLNLESGTIQKADIRICSWDVYEVWLNGKVVGVKPTWANVKFIDLTPHIRRKRNELLIRVVRREKLPDKFVQTWTVGRATPHAGVIAKLRILSGNEREEIVYSDRSWNAAAVSSGEALGRRKTLDDLPWTEPVTEPHTGGNPFSYS
jgi:hypothetical protein